MNIPRIFEIGYRGAYDLTPVISSKNQTKPLHPERYDCWKKLQGKDFWFYLFFLLFLPTGIFTGLVFYNRQKTKKIENYYTLEKLKKLNKFKKWNKFEKWRKWNKIWMVFLITCFFSFGALTFYAFLSSLDGEGEPLTFFDGISIWPTELLRLFSGLLAIFFLFYSAQGIMINDEKIK